MAKPLLMQIMDATHGKGLTPADKLVLVYLAVKQGGNGECWPGVRTIAKDLGLSEDTVKKSTRRLCPAGLIRKTSGSRGRKHSNRYSVCLEKRGAERPISDGTKGAQSALLPAKKRGAPAEKKGRRAPQNTSGIHHSITCITFDWNTHAFVGITEDYLRQSADAFPAVDIPAEIRRAALWCRNNPTKARRRKDWPRFLGNWFAKAQRDTEAGNGKPDADDDTLTEEEIVAKARAGGSKLAWLTGEAAHA